MSDIDSSDGSSTSSVGCNSVDGIARTPDFEDPRLNIEGFVISYFSWKFNQAGYEWSDAPLLPYGEQPEHDAMREMACIFESRHSEELNALASELLEDENLSYTKYCEVLDCFGRTEDCSPLRMSYGRMVGLMAFGGVVGLQMMDLDMRREVQQVVAYTSKFIGNRIRLSWSDDQYNWAGFMTTYSDIMKRNRNKQIQEDRRRSRSRWSLVGLAALVGVGAFIGSRVFLKT